MRAIRLRPLSIGALALLMFAETAAAQTQSSAILNTLEVQELVTRAQPGDHARLSAHFAALAERYTADAKQHTAMAQAFIGSPIQRIAAERAADHCRRLAQLNTQSATTLRELAAHHDKLAAGTPATAPRAGARFEAGAGAATPSDEALRQLAAKASTSADHRALEEYFVTQAKRYTADADEHVTTAGIYRSTGFAAAASACDRVVKLWRDAAKEASAAAAQHKDLAGSASKRQ
jgi:hypothetical protein